MAGGTGTGGQVMGRPPWQGKTILPPGGGTNIGGAAWNGTTAPLWGMLLNHRYLPGWQQQMGTGATSTATGTGTSGATNTGMVGMGNDGGDPPGGAAKASTGQTYAGTNVAMTDPSRKFGWQASEVAALSPDERRFFSFDPDTYTYYRS